MLSYGLNSSTENVTKWIHVNPLTQNWILGINYCLNFGFYETWRVWYEWEHILQVIILLSFGIFYFRRYYFLFEFLLLESLEVLISVWSRSCQPLLQKKVTTHEESEEARKSDNTQKKSDKTGKVTRREKFTMWEKVTRHEKKGDNIMKSENMRKSAKKRKRWQHDNMYEWET